MKNTSFRSDFLAKLIKSSAEFNLAINIVFYRYISEYNKLQLLDHKPIPVNSIEDLKNGIEVICNSNSELGNLIDLKYINDFDPWRIESFILYIYNIDLEEYQVIGSTLIDILLEFNADNNRVSGIYSTPQSVGNIISQIVANQFKDNTALTVYNPCVGLGSLIMELNNYLPQDTKYYAEDLNRDAIRWAKMRLIVNNIISADLREADVLEYPSFYDSKVYQKFDIVVTNPPFGLRNWRGNKDFTFNKRWENYPLRMERHSAESAFLMQALDSLNKNGFAAIILPNNFIYNGRDKEVRKFLLQNRLLEGIIHLPTGVFNRAMISTSIVFLSRKNNENVFFIDASKEFVKDKFQNIISKQSIQKIVETWKDREIIKEFSNLISIDLILQDDAILDFKRYEVQEQIASSDKQLISLEDIVKVAPRNSEISEELKLIRIKNLSDDPFNYLLNIENIEFESNNGRRYQKITSKVLLVSRRFNKLKPTLVEATEDNPIYLSNDIIAFDIMDNNISLDYLALQLYTDFVSVQLDSKSMGSTIPTITTADVLNIKIELVSLVEQEQQLFYQASKLQADKDKIIESNLQDTIDNLVNQRTNELKWQLHNLRNGDLLSIKNKASVLKKVFVKIPEVSNLIIDNNRNLSVQDIINELYENTTDLAKKLSSIYEEQEKFGKKTDFSILKFIKNFVEDQKYVSSKLVSYNQIFENLKHNHIVSFNEKDLDNVLSNVFENILRHGFKGEPTSEDKIYIKYEFEDNFIIVSIFNTGIYIPINSDDYFADGGKQGKTGNSGKGGYIIKQCMERNDGVVNIESYDDIDSNDYVFKIDLKFKLIN